MCIYEWRFDLDAAGLGARDGVDNVEKQRLCAR